MGTFLVHRTGRDWTFRLVDAAGESVLKGGRHATRVFALMTIETVRVQSEHASAYTRTLTAGGRYAFALTGGDGRQIGTSSAYATSERREEIIASCKAEARMAPIIEESTDEEGSWLGKVLRSRKSTPAGKDAEGSGGKAFAPRYQIDQTGAGYRLVLRDEHGRGLLAALPCVLRGDCAQLAEQIRNAGADNARYSLHLSDTGAFSFRVHDGAGKVLATSRYYETQKERDADLERCLTMTHHALSPVVPALPRGSVSSGTTSIGRGPINAPSRRGRELPGRSFEP